jgi:hypothetical protein
MAPSVRSTLRLRAHTQLGGCGVSRGDFTCQCVHRGPTSPPMPKAETIACHVLPENPHTCNPQSSLRVTTADPLTQLTSRLHVPRLVVLLALRVEQLWSTWRQTKQVTWTRPWRACVYLCSHVDSSSRSRTGPAKTGGVRKSNTPSPGHDVTA